MFTLADSSWNIGFNSERISSLERITMAVNPFFAALAPAAMLSVGTALQAKDSNKTGADDAVGSILVAAAPAVSMAIDGNNGSSKALTKAMTAVRDAAQAYLDSTA